MPARDEPSLAGKLLLAQDAERTRIARELHSGVGQQIAAVSLIASNLKRRLATPGDEPIPEFALIHMKLSEIARELQNLSRQLHPAVVEHSGIVAGLESLTKLRGLEFEAQGEFDQLTLDAALGLYRVAEGALRNVTGPASVRLRGLGDGVELDISGAIGDALELSIIRERAKLAGAEIEIRSGPKGGIRLVLRGNAKQSE